MPQKRRERLVGALLALAAIAPGAAFAEAAGQWQSGQQIYTQTCALCHNAGVGPSLLGRELPPDLVKYMALNGLRAMPAFRPTDFNAKDLDMLAVFIRDSKAPAAAPTPADKK